MRGRVKPVNGAVGRGDARSVGALALVTLVFLFFLQAQRAYLASLFALVYDAVFPTFSLLGLAAAALPLAVLAAPLTIGALADATSITSALLVVPVMLGLAAVGLAAIRVS